MRIPAFVACLLLPLAALVGCGKTIEPPANPVPAELRGFPEQTLAIEKANGRETLRVWVADSSERQQQGLMFVRSMPRDRGMLFPQARPRPMTMWMKNTYIPLDMVFVGEGDVVIGVAADTTPLSEALIESPAPVTAVLELNAGEAARRGIARGDRVIANLQQTR